VTLIRGSTNVIVDTGLPIDRELILQELDIRRFNNSRATPNQSTPRSPGGTVQRLLRALRHPFRRMLDEPLTRPVVGLLRRRLAMATSHSDRSTRTRRI
jgi:hypothetical protein